MMVIDEAKQLGWFVSDRYQPEGKVCVYLFIPNDNRERVDSEDIELKRARASIASIKDSWKPGSNYEGLIHFSSYRDSLRTYRDKKRFHVPDP